ncbi:MAG: rhamnulokinase [Frankiaceae bacterium]|nr:rhamnulokinase [Frankiaceae bacterium]
MTVLAAVDLGASSGRVVAGLVGNDGVDLHEVHRFPNQPARDPGGTLRWDIGSLYADVCTGLRKVVDRFGHPATIGIDSWAVDYALLDVDGTLLADPVHYRDERNRDAQSELLSRVTGAELFARTGIAQQPFNTLGRLDADRRRGLLDRAARVVLIPDLIGYWLTGRLGTELTNASTTQLLDVRTATWDTELAAHVGVDLELFAPLRRAGEPLGRVRDSSTLFDTDHPPRVVTVASHDTASAVAAVPATDAPLAFVATGTWSLVGLELDEPVITADARTTGFTNELGVEDRIRFLRNVNGFWLIQQYLHELREQDPTLTHEQLLAAAADEPADAAVFDVDSPLFAAPGPMSQRVREACRSRGSVPPQSPPAMTRCILSSMATGIADALADGSRLSGVRPDEVHLVGGGARSALFCQLVADTVGLPLTAGPVEATAWGNVLVQAQALGLHGPGLPALRAVVRRHAEPTRYLPRERVAAT